MRFLTTYILKLQNERNYKIILRVFFFLLISGLGIYLGVTSYRDHNRVHTDVKIHYTVPSPTTTPTTVLPGSGPTTTTTTTLITKVAQASVSVASQPSTSTDTLALVSVIVGGVSSLAAVGSVVVAAVSLKKPKAGT